MSDLLEKAASALAALEVDEAGRVGWAEVSDWHRAAVRAVGAALIEPTVAMVKAGQDWGGGYEIRPEDAEHAWKVMMRAALGDGL